jgi:sugar diacid utilization regulator
MDRPLSRPAREHRGRRCRVPRGRAHDRRRWLRGRTGDVVALRDTAVGYEQAFHALAVARSRPERWARFDTRLDLATPIGPDGLAWATSVLNPLITYVPTRGNGPDAQELTATARSWLSFSMEATRNLKIHRNTLVARLRLIGDLHGLDLGRTDQSAVLDIALRIRAAPHVTSVPADPSRAVTLDDLLRAPAVQQWARATLRPLREAANGAVLESTLRAWLDCDSRLSATADALGDLRARCAQAAVPAGANSAAVAPAVPECSAQPVVGHPRRGSRRLDE